MNAESVPVGREGAQVEVSERPCWYAGTAAAIGVFVAVFVPSVWLPSASCSR